MLEELPHTSSAQGQSRKLCIMVFGELHHGHMIFTCGREKAKYNLVGTRLRIAFQMKF